ncbi:MAG: ABC transporter ATP-binding protein [Gracilibacter sp. BRH_c7a]|nr:MAG: ABC transporter ATP-binding protein [Gracilibacter sp. BRH_c7a]
MSTILSVDNITKIFGKSTVVDRISFEVNRGEILGLVGPNGAGKSTIIRCLLGIIHPDSGSINYSLDNSNKLNSSKVGYLPEERGLYKDAKIIDILMYIANLKNYPLDKARRTAEEYFEKLDLKGRDKVKIQELSKGMAQKVQFIASIIHEPEFLVLDEPLSGFDPVSQNIFIEEIKNLAAKGTAILLSSHQMNMVESLCNRIFMINKGQRVLYGRLNDIKDRHGSYKCELTGENDPHSLSRLPYVSRIDKDDQTIILHLENNITPNMFISELPSDLDIKEMNINRISLHDIFVKTVSGGVVNE